jgi:hypothetical protein
MHKPEVEIANSGQNRPARCRPAFLVRANGAKPD